MFLCPKEKAGIVYSEETPCKDRSLYDVVTSNFISGCAECIRNEILNFKNPF